MNIKTATEQIKGAVRAYLAKDENGLYLIPPQMQRPLIMMGPPGIGKTAIVSEVAEELGVNFVSYSMTHHTRQSALGLPYIADATYGGKEYKVSRYTMSEIIAATYDAIERTGIPEGIIFLDEVNCVSETLAPAMLQFLQYKTFGQHKLPVGWVIVTAGNPPEYNRSAREFDAAMLDRMKRIDIEPDLDVWMDYATTHGVHPAILTYLTNKPQNFYHVHAGVESTSIVTARGWEDLSRMILAYEHEGLSVDLNLIAQYLQDQEIAEEFSLYLELFEKYQDDYQVSAILSGAAGEELKDRAKEAPFDERVALVNLLLDVLLGDAHRLAARKKALLEVRQILAKLKEADSGASLLASLTAQENECQLELRRLVASGFASGARQMAEAKKGEILETIRKAVARAVAQAGGSLSQEDSYNAAKESFNAMVRDLGAGSKEFVSKIDCAIDFVNDVYGDSQEMLIFMTHLAVDPDFMHFVAEHGSKKFVEHSRGLMFHDRSTQLLNEVDKLEGLA